MTASIDNASLPEVWGGIECTINRVGDTYFEQLQRLGHVDRPDDLDLFAGLGLKAIRYPVLWERVAPDGLERADWSWPDQQLTRLRELGIRPIVGLVHHGSGPRDTDLTDAMFPERLAVFAEAVARRYPWVEDYTPVNEPLTTARFSALYGHWYPHHRDDRNFARALLNQNRAVVLAMRAVREVNPVARLVQTDDLGRTYSTPRLAYQADFENERRWLTYDLLTGALTRERPMWSWLRKIGVDEGELQWFLDNPCQPDVLGFNTYLSSERYLDDRIERYSAERPGSNGRDTYVDVLAARVLPDSLMGTRGLLGEAWERYRLPLAITEVHNGGDREEQLRWLDEVWRGALAAREGGADVRAVTVWALLGLYDWPNLVTRQDDIYEPGVFDIRGPMPRPTAIARMVTDLASEGEHRHPVLGIPGWWRRPDRLWYESDAMEERPAASAVAEGSPAAKVQPILIVGEPNRLRYALEAALARRVIPFQVADRGGEEGFDLGRIGSAIDDSRAWAVIDAGSERLYRGTTPEAIPVTRMTPSNLDELATACAERDLPLLTFSSDVVFDAGQGRSSPIGTRKFPTRVDVERQARIEAEAIGIHPRTLIVRTGPLFTGTAERDALLDTAFCDTIDDREIVTPTHRDDLVHAVIDLLIDGAQGFWHLTNGTSLSWARFQRMAAGAEPMVEDAFVTRQVRTDETPERLASPATGSNHGGILPELRDAIERSFMQV
jgi:dTDP-4-dehydrorhamnose reductase